MYSTGTYVPVPTCSASTEGSLDKLPCLDPLVESLGEPGLELGAGHVLLKHPLDETPAQHKENRWSKLNKETGQEDYRTSEQEVMWLRIRIAENCIKTEI